MDLQEIAYKLRDRNLRRIAEVTGVKYFTVRTIANGDAKRPAIDDVKRLVEYLEQN
jgi:hypothetical protein